MWCHQLMTQNKWLRKCRRSDEECSWWWVTMKETMTLIQCAWNGANVAVEMSMKCDWICWNGWFTCWWKEHWLPLSVFHGDSTNDSWSFAESQNSPQCKTSGLILTLGISIKEDCKGFFFTMEFFIWQRQSIKSPSHDFSFCEEKLGSNCEMKHAQLWTLSFEGNKSVKLCCCPGAALNPAPI